MLNPKFQIRNSIKLSKGFTLIEAVVATAVFAFAVSSVLGVYISISQLDSKTRAQRAVTQNARYIMEFLGKEIRNGTIHYTAYANSTTQGRADLYVTNLEGVLQHIYQNGEDIVLDKIGIGSTNLNSNGVRVISAQFLVSPTTTPFTTAKTVNSQPSVTVLLHLQSDYGNRSTDQASIKLQSTFTVRNYPSRQP